MIDNELRRIKDKLVHPIALLLSRRLTPFSITLAAFLTGLIATYALWRGQYGLAMGLWLFSRVLDGIDGAMARLSKRQSALGGYLDLVCDIVVYTLFPIAAAGNMYAQTNDSTIFIALSFLLGAYYINLTGWSILAAILERRQAQSRAAPAGAPLTTIIMPRGIIEGLETTIIYVLFCIIPQFLWHVYIITAILVIISALIRVGWAIHHRAVLGRRSK